MSIFVDLLPQTDILGPGTAEIEREEFCSPRPVVWDPGSFAEEQVRGLVRQVFFPGWPKPARQVVFSAVDPDTDVSDICLRVGLTLSEQGSGSTCLVEAERSGHGLDEAIEKIGLNLIPVHGTADLLDPSRKRSEQLCLVPRNVFLGENGSGSSGAWLRDRLAELRRSFDYTIIHGPAAGIHTEAALLGSLCDGVVLVVEANSTRRQTAQKVKEKLHSANARLLGAVLSQRTFPIPQAIYRRL